MKKKYRIITRSAFGGNNKIIPYINYYKRGTKFSIAFQGSFGTNSNSYSKVYGLLFEFLNIVLIIELEISKRSTIYDEK